MIALTLVLLAVLVVAALRVEHLVASAAWIAFRGEQWAQEVGQYKAKRQRDPVRMAEVYAAHDGGMLPYLYFGVKGYRLWRWGHELSGGRSAAVRALRLAWKFWLFAPLVTIGVAGLALVPVDYPLHVDVLLLLIVLTCAVGMIEIAAETVLSAHTMGSYAVLHHRWPKPVKRPARRPRTGLDRIKENAVYLGCCLIAVLVAAVMALVVDRQFAGNGDLTTRSSVVDSVATAFQSALLGFAGPTWNDVSNVAGAVAALTTLLMYGCYLVVVPAWGAPRLTS